MTSTLPQDPELTDRQARILQVLFDHLLTHGFQASLDDVCDAMHVKNKNGIHSHYRALARKGWISLADTKARAIVFLRQPDGTPFAGLRFVPAPKETPRDCA